MRLRKFQVRGFRCIRDSGPVPVGDLAALIGKNENGKTALLQALAKTVVPLTIALDKLSAKGFPKRVSSQVDDTQINTERISWCIRGNSEFMRCWESWADSFQWRL